MRLVGPLPPGRPAGGLLAFLDARGLECSLRERELWVCDEELLPEAGRALRAFRDRPGHPAWRRAVRAAVARAEAERKASEEELRGRARRFARRERRLRRVLEGAPSSRPLTLGLLGLAGLSAWLGPHESAALLPVAATCYWLHALGTRVEASQGSRRFGALVLALALATQLALMAAGQGPAGLSGVAFGLLGFVTGRDPGEASAPPRGLASSMAAWLLLCAAGAVAPPVLLAQCAGLAAGLAARGLSAGLCSLQRQLR